MNSHNTATLRQTALRWLTQARPAVLVQVQAVRGSTPRETDARMVISADEVQGTVGGGHLEWQAIAMARQALFEHALASPPAPPMGPWTQTYALGPTLGQCCGGVMELAFEPLSWQALSRWPEVPPRFHLELHGAGHVGQAIVKLLCDIDCTVRWIDQRLDGSEHTAPNDHIGLPGDDEMAQLPAHIQCLATDDAAAEVADAPPRSAHLVLTHRHDLDLSIIDALLRRSDVLEGTAWVGLIGSKTKRAAFEHRLAAKGHDDSVVARMVCPIGLPGITGKAPAVIAVAVVAQLLQR
ncbi:MAG: xanthine dehydrogenase accessory protein XdhC [Burkholderiales bacterium]|nr:xanthine dehydrogenase accessory protein XdhC [Burkholderiales bacterium]